MHEFGSGSMAWLHTALMLFYIIGRHGLGLLYTLGVRVVGLLDTERVHFMLRSAQVS